MQAVEPELEALQINELLVFFRVAPQRGLALSHDGSGHQRVDADSKLAQLTRQAARQ